MLGHHLKELGIQSCWKKYVNRDGSQKAKPGPKALFLLPVELGVKLLALSSIMSTCMCQASAMVTMNYTSETESKTHYMAFSLKSCCGFSIFSQQQNTKTTHFLNEYKHFVCLYVCVPCMCQCLQKPEGAGSPGTEVTVVNCHKGPLHEQQKCC